MQKPSIGRIVHFVPKDRLGAIWCENGLHAASLPWDVRQAIDVATAAANAGGGGLPPAAGGPG